MTALVSILIPVHNATPWLAATLESVLAQTWQEKEIIVVDDGSTDDSLAVARSFAARGVQVAAQPNRGAAAARNHALRLARGAYVKFIDADDLLSPASIAHQVAALDSRPRHVAMGAWARFHGDPATAVPTPRACWHDAGGLDWIKETWRDAEPMYQCGMFLIPRALLDQAGGWDERLTLIDDFEFFTRLILASAGVVFTPEAMLYYRSALAGSLSAQKSRRAWESACLSTKLGVGYLLARENSAATRRLSANMLQKLVYALYPAQEQLAGELLREIEQLGGSDLPPDGGPALKLLARIIGWRAALRWHARLGRRPAASPS